MTSALSKALRLASVTICLIVAASFLVFAINQTSTASGQQQDIIDNTAPPATTSGSAHSGTSPAHHGSTFRKDLDEVSEQLTSPVSGLANGSSEWANRALRLLFALLVYGFMLGYLARVLRVRA